MASVQVKCSDGIIVDADREVAMKMSLSLRRKIEAEPEATTIVLDNVNGRSFTRVMEYCNVHCPPKSIDLKVWDNKFVKVEPSVLCELASAAYHLEIKPMVDLTCYAIAQLLKGNTPEEIRRIFNIIYDFGPEDDVPPPTIRDKLRNKWIRRSNKKNGTKNIPVELALSPSGANLTPSPNLSPVVNPIPSPAVCSSDTRSVDELLSFINDTKSPQPENGTKNGRKSIRKDKKKTKVQKENGNSDKHEAPEKQNKLTHENGKQTQLHNGQGKEEDQDTSSSHSEDSNDTDENASSPSDEQHTNNHDFNNSTLDDVDREVEEFRQRLEAAEKQSNNKQKVTLPATLSIALSIALGMPKK